MEDPPAARKVEKPPAYANIEKKSLNERPPSYREADEIPWRLPSLDLAKSNSTSLPVSPDQCVAHLKFLAVLSDLQDSVSKEDGLFDLFDSQAEKFPASSNEAYVCIREKRWAVYTARAVERYTAWWFTCLPMSRTQVTMTDLENPKYEKIVDCNEQILWTVDNMPPLDILMVWHSHMLNPRGFLEDCIRYGRMSTWKTGFPFETVNKCVDDLTLEYKTSPSREQTFEKQVKLRWNNANDSPSKVVTCPRCNSPNIVPWTDGGIGDSLQEAFQKNTGYADASFEAQCSSCKLTIDRDRLKVAKFRQDLSDLMEDRRPMSGSIYNIDGIPEGRQNVRNPLDWNNMTFPARFMQAVGKEILAFTDPRASMDWCKSINDLRAQLEVKIRDRRVLTATHGHFRSVLH